MNKLLQSSEQNFYLIAQLCCPALGNNFFFYLFSWQYWFDKRKRLEKKFGTWKVEVVELWFSTFRKKISILCTNNFQIQVIE